MPRNASKVGGQNIDRQQQLRELLHDIGPMSTEALFQATKDTHAAGFTRARVTEVMMCMPDVYVAGWAPSRTSMKYVPVWAAVKVPDDAPYPTKPPPTWKTYRKIIRP